MDMGETGAAGGPHTQRLAEKPSAFSGDRSLGTSWCLQPHTLRADCVHPISVFQPSRCQWVLGKSSLVLLGEWQQLPPAWAGVGQKMNLWDVTPHRACPHMHVSPVDTSVPFGVCDGCCGFSFALSVSRSVYDAGLSPAAPCPLGTAPGVGQGGKRGNNDFIPVTELVVQGRMEKEQRFQQTEAPRPPGGARGAQLGTAGCGGSGEQLDAEGARYSWIRGELGTAERGSWAQLDGESWAQLDVEGAGHNWMWEGCSCAQLGGVQVGTATCRGHT